MPYVNTPPSPHFPIHTPYKRSAFKVCDLWLIQWVYFLSAALSQTEMVAMLRSKARKTGVQTSHYRGVSLLKQTHKWHAQINVGGKQVTLCCHQQSSIVS